MKSSHDFIVTLLRNLGTRREITQYLSAFTSVESSRFAIVKVGGGVIRDQLDDLASSIAFLHAVGLRPIIVHGAGPQLTEALQERGVESEWIDGQRVTTPETLAVARRVFQRTAMTLADALESHDVRARPISTGVFEAVPSSTTDLGLVGEITGAHLEQIHATIKAGYLPIVSPLGETASGQILNINADVAVNSLARAVQPRKVVFLTPTGGLLDAHKNIIPAINLAEDYDRLINEDWVSGGMALKLREIKELLDGLTEHSTVSVASPNHLAAELFTHRGNGTLVRRGAHVRALTSRTASDEARIKGVLEQAFGRTLRDDYFERRPNVRIFIAGDYTAVAIVDGTGPAPYLDKFAVTAEAQGAGIAASMWNRLTDEFSSLFWRSRLDNAINPWYFSRADGTHRDVDWIVFWRGLTGRDAIESCINYAAELEPSFVDRRSAVQPVVIA
jgi:acetylglutamate kinase